MNHAQMIQRLAKALRLAGDLYALEDVLELVKSGGMQSFTDEHTWVITRVLDYPRARVLELFMVVGTMEGAHALSPQIEEFARSVNAVRIVAEGRLGWVSANESFGWKAKPTLNFYKDL